MSTFEALRMIRIYRSHHMGLPTPELVLLIRRIDATAYDFDAGIHLDSLLGPDVTPSDPIGFYQACIEVIIYRQPIWAKTIGLGRRKFSQKLSRDEQQCFRSARLLDDPAAPSVVAWWDRVTGVLRLSADQEKLRRARAAERLSLEHETHRLQNVGIKREPIWMAVDDNTAGYDVLSYDVGPYEPINRLIEVKSTIASPLRFFLTRNEWETAIKFGDRYIFHIWDLTSSCLHERTVAQIAPHIPTDNEKGRWANAEIPVTQN